MTTQWFSHRALAFLLLVALTLPIGLVAAAPYPRPARVSRLDTPRKESPEGRDGWSTSSSISGMAHFVAFDSSNPDLVSSDINGATDVFLRNVRRGRTALVSLGLKGLPALGVPSPLGTPGRPQVVDTSGAALPLSFDPSISRTGRFIAFSSAATNLVIGDTNGISDVFVYDRKGAELERVSVAAGGGEAAGLAGSFLPSISADGRFVSFTSDATNLVPDDENKAPDVFVHDRLEDRTTRASVSSTGEEALPCRAVTGIAPIDDLCLPIAEYPVSSINGNGAVVAFDSFASNLVEGDTNGIRDVFVRSLKAKKTERVSVASDGTEAQDPPGYTAEFRMSGSTISGRESDGHAGALHSDPGARALSDDGRFVVFVSVSPTLVPYDTNNLGCLPDSNCGKDIFVHDRKTERTERVSVDHDGHQANQGGVGPLAAGGHAAHPSISANGRYVTFRIDYNSQYPGTRYEEQIAVYDRRTGAVETYSGLPGMACEQTVCESEDGTVWVWSRYPDISPEGRYVTFAREYGRAEAPSLSGAALFLWERGDDTSTLSLVKGGRAVSPLGRSVIQVRDRTHDALVPDAAADLLGATVAHRAHLDDLYVRIEVERLGIGGSTRGPGMVYGLRFSAGDRRFEFRAAGIGEGRVGLFECLPTGCTELAELDGGVGTAGESIVAAVPLEELGLSGSAQLEGLEAFAGNGTYRLGALTVLDVARARV